MKKVIISSIFLSILQSILFFRKSLGFSVLLFVLAFILITLYLLHKEKKIQNTKAFILLVPIFLLSSTYFLYNNAVFGCLNIFVIIFLILFMLYLLTTKEFKDKLNTKILHLFRLFTDAFYHFEDFHHYLANRKQNKTSKKEKHRNPKSKEIVKAILISIPVILIVLLLLITADEFFYNVFYQLAMNIFRFITSINLYTLRFLPINIAMIIFVFYFMSGFLSNLLFQKEKTESKEITKKSFTLKGLTMPVLVTALNIIYLIFSMSQMTSLGLNNASSISMYARQGFYQLMIISFINFTIILIYTCAKNKPYMNYMKCMNVLLCIFTFIILASAFHRMYLNTSENGYSTARIFVFAILITESFLLLPSMLYLFTNKFDIVKSYLFIIITSYVVINFINIDKFVAKQNIDMYYSQNQRDIDFEYLTNLSIDAIPEIYRLKNSNNEMIKLFTNEYLNTVTIPTMSWQEFNITKYQVQKLLSVN